ncbi:MnhB domain-containing protein [Kocuria rhizophila]|nr:MnhB domain-containing protein [Kocuria rhizophila]
MPSIAYGLGPRRERGERDPRGHPGVGRRGEVSVLTVAATGIASLIFVKGRRWGPAAQASATSWTPGGCRRCAARLRPTPHRPGPGGIEVARATRPVRTRTRSCWPTHAGPSGARSSSRSWRGCLHTFMLVSPTSCSRGTTIPAAGCRRHGLPGPDAALPGRRPVRARAGHAVNAGWMLGAGLALASLYALSPLFLGGAVMENFLRVGPAAVRAHWKFVTALIFDVGVYLIVVGLVLDILRSLGGQIDSASSALRSRTTLRKRTGRAPASA